MDLNKIVNKRNIIIFSLVAGIIAVWYVFSTVSWSDVVNAFSGATLELVLYYVLVQLGLMAVMTVRWQVILNSQGFKGMNVFKLNNYRLVGQAISFITPSAKLGGEPVRAGLLSSKEGIPFDKALSSVVIDKTLEVSTSGAFFIIGGLFILLSFVVSPDLKYMILGLSLFFLILVFLFNYRVMRGKHFFHTFFDIIKLTKIKSLKKFMKKVKDFELLIIKFYHKDRVHFLYTLLISLVGWILMFVEYYIAGKILGQELSLLQIFLVFSFVGAAYIVPVPMALGALEAGQMSVFNLLKIGTATGLALSLIIRVKDMFLAGIGILLLFIFGLNFKKVVQDTKYLDEEVHKIKNDK